MITVYRIWTDDGTPLHSDKDKDGDWVLVRDHIAACGDAEILASQRDKATEDVELLIRKNRELLDQNETLRIALRNIAKAALTAQKGEKG